MIISQAVELSNANFEEMWKKNDPARVQKIKLTVADRESQGGRSLEEDQIKILITQRDNLKEELKKLVEELKLYRISTLKNECNRSNEYASIQVILCLILGLASGFFLPYYYFL